MTILGPRLIDVVGDGALSDMPDRLVVSPGYGPFIPATDGMFTSEGELVACGALLGKVASADGDLDVYAPCDGWVMGYMARDGERVKPGIPLVHLRSI